MGAMTRDDDVATQLARLTARGLQITGDHGGGHPAWMTPMDIAACIAGVPEPHASLLMAKYCDDQRAALKAIDGVTDDLMRAGCALNAQLLAVVVIELHLRDRLCSRCKGRGTKTRRDGLVVNCERCDGKGRTSAASTEIAGRARLKIEDYRKYCKAAVQKVQRAIEIGEAEGFRHCWNRMRRG